MAAKVILDVVAGPVEGQTFAFDRHDTFLVGRHSNCHVCLPRDGYLSRHHFIVEANPPDARIRDLGSLNGTHVNGVKYGGRELHEKPEDAAARQYPQVDLKHGDQIVVGSTQIRVSIELPLSCCQCGNEIPESQQHEAEWMTGSYLCVSCRGTLTGRLRPVTTVVRPRCERCGKDVSAEVRNGRRGQYVCQACQTDLMAQEGGLRRLMQEAAGKPRDPAALRLDGYEIGEELGKGGMGVVYRAVRKAGGQPAAVKIMLARVAVSDSARKMFLREIDVSRQLVHPNIVALLESGAAGSAFYFVMEYCNRGSLHQWVNQQGGRLPLALAVPILMQCLDGLEHAHRQGFVHRDLKPQNILLDDRGGRFVAKVADFGLAKSFQGAGLSGMTATGGHGGTYHFMPREQLRDFKYVRPASDVWSMAAAFYRVLTGHYPRDFPPGRDPMEVVLNDEPVPIRHRDPEMPAAVAAVIDGALTSDPGKRCQTAGDLKAAFQQAVHGRPP